MQLRLGCSALRARVHLGLWCNLGAIKVHLRLLFKKISTEGTEIQCLGTKVQCLSSSVPGKGTSTEQNFWMALKTSTSTGRNSLTFTTLVRTIVGQSTSTFFDIFGSFTSTLGFIQRTVHF